MKFVENVYGIVTNTIMARKEIAENIKVISRDPDRSDAAKEKETEFLKNQAAKILADARTDLEVIRGEFKTAADNAFLIDGSMNNADAAIFQSGITLTPEQFEHIVERNKLNPFVISLARKYYDEHQDTSFIATLPPTHEQAVTNFDSFIDAAKSITADDPFSFRYAFFLKNSPPVGADLIESFTESSSEESD